MATLVGTQSAVTDYLRSLLELEYDALAAYDAAIARLQAPALKLRFQEFRADHQRHVHDIAAFLASRGIRAPHGPDAKALLTGGKVVVGNWMGDRGVVSAMLSNENDTNAAYERGLERSDLTAELGFLLGRNLDDEQRHRLWMSEQLLILGEGPEEPASEEFLGARWG
jgi:hypothetical protein